VANRASAIEQTAIDVSPGIARKIAASTTANGLPNQFDIQVPDAAATLALHLQGSTGDATLELHLYNCTSGECFSYDFTVPAAREQSMVIRNPQPGRWIAAVNSAPFPTARTPFVLDEIVAGAAHRQASAPVRRLAGARWTESVPLPRDRWQQADAAPIVMLELIDVAAEREGRSHPWENRNGLTNFAERPGAVARTILRVK
jgi:hypothetical protein